MAIAIIAFYITSNKSSLIINQFSKVVRECFIDESDAATLVKCYLQIEQQEDKTRAKYCCDNGFNFSVYAEVRIKVYNVINTISIANGDKSFEESEKQENNSLRSTFSKYIISLDSSLILSSLDNFVQLQCAQKRRIDPYCLSQFTFTGLTNLKEDPVYNYECNKVPITCHERPGCTSASNFSNVFFFDMQFIKSSGLYLGKYMHRIQNSYKCCYSVNVPQNALILPFTKMLVKQYFANNPDFQFIKLMNLRTLSEETEYFGESNDKKSVFYTVNKRISDESIQIMKNVVQQLIKISSKCPTTLISRYPGLSDYYVEFFQTNNLSDARFIQKSVNNTNIAPFAYALNIQALNLLVHNKLDFYISYYFDLNMNSTIFKQSAFQHDFNYTGQQLSRKRNGHNVNQLIIISQKQIPNLLQLQWIGQEEEFNGAQQQYILRETKVETSIILQNGNQENYLPFNIVSKELQRHPQTVWDINPRISQLNLQSFEFFLNRFLLCHFQYICESLVMVPHQLPQIIFSLTAFSRQAVNNYNQKQGSTLICIYATYSSFNFLFTSKQH
ncbi:Helicase-related_protein [Hexamita inflata]|uniref:Helicase-related protein n=1 Tax=Hexamita inflata TaxID=28002 RepID=A0AA86UGS9_9EUKA|nr:Helicase-related protein [Hexamita inflata]